METCWKGGKGISVGGRNRGTILEGRVSDGAPEKCEYEKKKWDLESNGKNSQMLI